MQISTLKCKKALALLWFVGGGAFFLFMLFQTIFQRYGNRVDEAWSWFFPTIMPTLSFMLGVFVMEALHKGDTRPTVDRFVFLLSFGLSLVYLLAVALVLLLQDFADSPFEVMTQSNLYLGPWQGLVAASLGAFFVQHQPTA